MIIHNKTQFVQGAILLASFALIFWIIISPVFPGQQNRKLTGLEYADEVFNQLSKGSSYFIPAVRGSIEKFPEALVTLQVYTQSQEETMIMKELLEKAHTPLIEIGRDKIIFESQLGQILSAATSDANFLFNNNGEAITKKYGLEPLKVSSAWWHLLNPCIKELQKQHKIKEAQLVDEVVRKAIEPGNNFYGIESASVLDHIWLISSLLIFYIIYTLWYGTGIYKLFEGLGFISVKNSE